MQTKLRRFFPVLLGLLLPSAAIAQEVTVSAAASLTNAFTALAPAFEKATPGVSLRLNFGASGALLQQIAQGAPVDVFASADQATMDRAASRHLIEPGSRVDFATNSVVLIEPARGGIGLASLQDLERPAVRRIAVGKVATVPAGRYTREALENAGLWSTLEPKFVFADSVRQVLDYVSRGEVEAGFVYGTDATIMKNRIRIARTVTGHAPVSYPVALVKDSGRKEAGARFVAFLATAPAREILSRYGFGTP
jgi:molybdate transport system substrate-binding protein